MARGRPKKNVLNQTSEHKFVGEVSVMERPSLPPVQAVEKPSAPIKSPRKPEEPKVPLITQISTRDMMEIEDRKPVTGVFRLENKKPGESGIFRLGAIRKYKEDKMQPWIFEHGKTYTVPKWLADWLNGGNEERKTPGAVKVIHNDQWNDLNNKRPLTEPVKMKMYSFTPTVNW